MLSPEEIQEMTLDLDTPFQFKCRSCGKCCKDRHDIILKSRDIFRIAQYLKLSTKEVLARYCCVSLGPNSKLPVVTLQAVGTTQHCPFMENRKCAVHPVKPEVCALYPLGRYISPNDDANEIKYLLQPMSCGGVSKTHTVRSWLARFNIPVNDRFYVSWTTILSTMSLAMQALIQQKPAQEQLAFYYLLREMLYENYQTDLDFDWQFQRNMRVLADTVKKLVEEGLEPHGKE